jgi:hypothetical protein
MGWPSSPRDEDGQPMDVPETLLMTGLIAAGSLTLAWMVWTMSGFVISPKAAGRPAREVTREQELLRRLEEIDRRLPGDFWRRYEQLVSMRKAETLRPDSPEHGELIRMTDELECRHADRLALLSELAKLRGTSLAEVMKHGDVAAWNHG